MKDFTIAIYCFLDDLLLKFNSKELDKRRKLTNSQVITTVIISAKYFYGNQESAYLETHSGFKIPDKNNWAANYFSRILHSLTDLIVDLLFSFDLIFNELNLQSVYIINTFPIVVCKNIQISRSKPTKGKEFKRHNASKESFFVVLRWSLLRFMLLTGDSIPVEFMVTAGTIHDNTTF